MTGTGPTSNRIIRAAADMPGLRIKWAMQERCCRLSWQHAHDPHHTRGWLELLTSRCGNRRFSSALADGHRVDLIAFLRGVARIGDDDSFVFEAAENLKTITIIA